MSNLMSPDMQIDKTLSVEGVAADAKAVGDAMAAAVPEMECGTWKSPNAISNNDMVKINISFTRKHDTPPKAVIVSYRIYEYFYGALHLDGNNPTGTGFSARYIPIVIGNGSGTLTVDWLAIW